jgi:hypothetical protein
MCGNGLGGGDNSTTEAAGVAEKRPITEKIPDGVFKNG